MIVKTMKIRQLGDALLKQGHTPFLSFLAPAVPASARCTSFPLHFRPDALKSRGTDRRYLGTRTSPRQKQSTATAIQDESVPDIPAPQHAQNPNTRKRDEHTENLRNLMDSISAPRPNKRINANRPPPHDSESPQRSPDLMKTARNMDRNNHVGRQQGRIVNHLAEGDPSLLTLLKDSTNKVSKLEPRPPPLRLDAYMGRSVAIKKGVPLWQALRYLDIKLKVNKVKKDMQKQQFHERPGLKRKRLRRERWRRTFKDGFKAVVDKVQSMRRQGW